MKEKTPKQKLWLAIAGGLLLLLLVGGFAGWQVVRNVMHRYFWDSYDPLTLDAQDIGGYPAAHRLTDVPWIAAHVPTCQSTALQMIAAQHGIEEPRSHFDFVTGFTYGAGELPGVGFMPVGTDPETGLLEAAPYLGLVRHYYVTDDADLYLDALRYYLSQGYAIRVSLDVAVLYGWNAKMPHNEVLVGYDEGGFHYYEPVCRSPVPCEPGHRSPGHEGLYVSDQALLDAVLAQARLFFYPWRYALTLFEPGPVKHDFRPLWTRNGEALIGGQWYGRRWGAVAIEKLATRVERRGRSFDLSQVEIGLEIAAHVRHDNAAYLREAFASQPEVDHAATLFDRAAEDYQAAGEAIQDGIASRSEASRIAAWLRDAAAAERAAGEIMCAWGDQDRVAQARH